MPAATIRRYVLYFFIAFFAVFGITGLFAPAFIAGKLDLAPVALAGAAELRGFYGGGFLGFSLVILAGLRCQQAGSGLLLAMAIIMGSIAAGRLFSMALDHEFAFNIPAGIAELLVSATCYLESRAQTARA